MKLKELAADHLGKRITVHSDGATITGLLSGVNHHCLLVSDMRLHDVEERLVPGRLITSVTIAGWGAKDFSPHHECEIEAF